MLTVAGHWKHDECITMFGYMQYELKLQLPIDLTVMLINPDFKRWRASTNQIQPITRGHYIYKKQKQPITFLLWKLNYFNKIFVVNETNGL